MSVRNERDSFIPDKERFAGLFRNALFAPSVREQYMSVIFSPADNEMLRHVEINYRTRVPRRACPFGDGRAGAGRDVVQLGGGDPVAAGLCADR